MNTKKLITHISNFFRTNALDHIGYGEFILQLLAWNKLDNDGQLDQKYSLKEFLVGNKRIEEVFLYLSEHNSLGVNKLAFTFNLNLLGAEILLKKILSVILEARKIGIDYSEAIESCLELVPKSHSISLPKELVELILKLAKVDSKNSVYCPFETDYKLSQKASEFTTAVYAETPLESALPFLINILLDRSISVKFSDPITNPSWLREEKLKQFDVSIANVISSHRHEQKEIFDVYSRFPEKCFYSEVLNIRHMLSQTASRVIVCTLNGVLFRTSSGEKRFKSDLLENSLIESIIALPSSLLSNTSLPCSVVVLNKENRSDSLLFVDASSEYFFEKESRTKNRLTKLQEIVDSVNKKTNGKFSYLASHSECENKEYNLLPERYVFSNQQVKLRNLLHSDKSIALEEIVDFLRLQSLKDEIVDKGQECHEIAVSDISDAPYVDIPKKKFFLSGKTLNKLSHLRLQPYDILLTVKGSIGKVGLVGEINESQNWFANQSFQVLRLKNNKYIKNPIVLYRYLSSALGQTIIQNLGTGGTTSLLQASDVKSLPVMLLPKQKQDELLNDHKEIVSLYEQIQELKEKSSKIADKWWSV